MYPTTVERIIAQITEKIGELAIGPFGVVVVVGGAIVIGVWVVWTIWSHHLSEVMKKNAKPIRPEEH